MNDIKKNFLIGKTEGKVVWKGFPDWPFTVLAKAKYNNTAVVEYVPGGGNPKVRYVHWDQLSLK